MSLPEHPDLSRFLFAQEDIYDTALSELRRGRKETHWMWFVFPQLAGLGHSAMARRYAIRSLEEAAAYLAHPVLGPRLLGCCRALLSVEGRSASQIFGDPDDIKLRSSMTLFSQVPDAPCEFAQVLERYYGGIEDQKTAAPVCPTRDNPVILGLFALFRIPARQFVRLICIYLYIF